jgi:HPt (histidine-containing phosphotransfer) domain-containing protein
MKEIFLERGFNDYLTKPIEMMKLHEILERWIPAKKQIKAKQNPGTGKNARVYSHVFDGKNVPGIDLAEGRDRYGDDQIYLEILRSYAATMPDFLDTLRNVSRETLDEYIVTIHGIKGASYQIYAGKTGREAETLEAAARAKDMKTLETRGGDFIKTLERLLENLRAFLAEAENEKKNSAAAKPDPALLEKLLEACRNYNTPVMEELVIELEKYSYESGAELVSWLRKQLDNIEYEAIRQRLENEELFLQKNDRGGE